MTVALLACNGKGAVSELFQRANSSMIIPVTKIHACFKLRLDVNISMITMLLPNICYLVARIFYSKKKVITNNALCAQETTACEGVDSRSESLMGTDVLTEMDVAH
jgi:hypothetical protein